MPRQLGRNGWSERDVEQVICWFGCCLCLCWLVSWSGDLRVFLRFYVCCEVGVWLLIMISACRVVCGCFGIYSCFGLTIRLELLIWCACGELRFICLWKCTFRAQLSCFVSIFFFRQLRLLKREHTCSSMVKEGNPNFVLSGFPMYVKTTFAF